MELHFKYCKVKIRSFFLKQTTIPPLIYPQNKKLKVKLKGMMLNPRCAMGTSCNRESKYMQEEEERSKRGMMAT